MKLGPPALLIAAPLAGAGLAQAQSMGDMKGMAMAPAGAKTGEATGVIRSVDAKAGTVTIQHQPIPAIGWPAMTMAFKAATPEVLHAAKVGQQVAFGVRVSGASAEVTSIKPR